MIVSQTESFDNDNSTSYSTVIKYLKEIVQNMPISAEGDDIELLLKSKEFHSDLGSYDVSKEFADEAWSLYMGL